MKIKKDTNHYIDKEKFYLEMVRYRESVDNARRSGRELPRIPEYIGGCILKLAQKLATHKSFIGYSIQWKQEMISDGAENCVQYINNFDPDKTNNPFAYFTQVIWYAFIRRIAKEKKQQYVKAKNLELLIVSDLLNEDISSSTVMTNDALNDLINSFENAPAKKPKEKKLAGVEKYMEKKE